MKVAVTGAHGLLDWHVRCALQASGIEVSGVEREHFAHMDRLVAAVSDADVIVHAAGANRGSDDEISTTNIGAATQLVTAVHAAGTEPHVIYLDSVQRDRATAYGRSKQAAADVLATSLDDVLDLVLPGVFGEHGRPFYNSVVSTFCHQLSTGVPLTMNDDAALELLPAQDLADRILRAALLRETGTVRVCGEPTSVAAVGAKLQTLHERYAAGVVPDISVPFDRALFNTLRSYRYPQLYPIDLDPHVDERGRLTEIVKSGSGGQTFISTTAPGVTRGNHFHRRKVERFVVVAGDAEIALRRLFTTEVVRFRVSGDRPVAIDMPTMHTHNITNVSDQPLVTLFWADEIFDSEHPDTTFEPV